jgi:hypothetical protein
MDAAPILPMDSMFYFNQGLQHELKSECLTDALGQPFTSLDALIQHAFVQEQKLLCKRSAPGPVNSVATELCNVQGAHNAGKRARVEDDYDQVGQHMDVERSSGRTDFEQAVFHLGMQFGRCGGCLGFIGDDEWHHWADCPINPKYADWE